MMTLREKIGRKVANMCGLFAVPRRTVLEWHVRITDLEKSAHEADCHGKIARAVYLDDRARDIRQCIREVESFNPHPLAKKLDGPG